MSPVLVLFPPVILRFFMITGTGICTERTAPFSVAVVIPPFKQSCGSVCPAPDTVEPSRVIDFTCSFTLFTSVEIT